MGLGISTAFRDVGMDLDSGWRMYSGDIVAFGARSVRILAGKGAWKEGSFECGIGCRR